MNLCFTIDGMSVKDYINTLIPTGGGGAVSIVTDNLDGTITHDPGDGINPPVTFSTGLDKAQVQACIDTALAGLADTFVTFATDPATGVHTFVSADGLTQLSVNPDTDTDTTLTWVVNADGSVTITDPNTAQFVTIGGPGGVVDTDTNVTFVANPDGSWTFTSPLTGATLDIPAHTVDTDTVLDIAFDPAIGWTFTNPLTGVETIIPIAAPSAVFAVDQNGAAYAGTGTAADPLVIPSASGGVDTFVTFATNPDGSVTFVSADGVNNVTISDTTISDTFVTFVTNPDGSITLTSADGLSSATFADTDTDTNITWVTNPDGSITLTSSLDGTTLDIDQSPDTDTNILYTELPQNGGTGGGGWVFSAPDGSNPMVIPPHVVDTDTNIIWVTNPDGSITLTNSLDGSTLDIDQTPDTDTNILYVANPDGSWTLSAPDGSNPMVIPAHTVDTDTVLDMAQNPDGSVTFTDPNTGEVITTTVSTPHPVPVAPIEIPASVDQTDAAAVDAWIVANGNGIPGQIYYSVGAGSAGDPDYAWSGSGAGAGTNIESPAGAAASSRVALSADGCTYEHFDAGGTVTESWKNRNGSQAYLERELVTIPVLADQSYSVAGAATVTLFTQTATFTNTSTCDTVSVIPSVQGMRMNRYRQSPGVIWQPRATFDGQNVLYNVTSTLDNTLNKDFIHGPNFYYTGREKIVPPGGTVSVTFVVNGSFNNGTSAPAGSDNIDYRLSGVVEFLWEATVI